MEQRQIVSLSDEIIFHSITACRICNSTQLDSVLDLGLQPPANSLYAPSGTSPSSIPLEIFRCNDCSTIQLGINIDPHYLFSDYLWVTGTSRAAIEYALRFAAWGNDLYSATEHSNLIVEIASNDGTFLREFQKLGWNVLGVDPAANICETANERGIPTWCDFFDISIAEKILARGPAPDLVVARNVIPHVQNIHGVIEGMAKLISGGGVGIIEFHKSSLLLDQLHYDYIYHEHLFYFSLKTMSVLLKMHGMTIFDLRESPISGGSWVVYFSVDQLSRSDRLAAELDKEERLGIDELGRWKAFAHKVHAHKQEMISALAKYDKPVLAYGASARSSTLINFCGFSRRDISQVVDKNRMKAGLICPGSDLPVVSFDESIPLMDYHPVIFLLAWNFRDEIINDLRTLGYKGEFIVPLPGQVSII